MTRKDYVLIARVIRDIGQDSTRCTVATQFADALGRENANFDRNKFLTACLGKANALAL